MYVLYRWTRDRYLFAWFGHDRRKKAGGRSRKGPRTIVTRVNVPDKDATQHIVDAPANKSTNIGVPVEMGDRNAVGKAYERSQLATARKSMRMSAGRVVNNNSNKKKGSKFVDMDDQLNDALHRMHRKRRDTDNEAVLREGRRRREQYDQSRLDEDYNYSTKRRNKSLSKKKLVDYIIHVRILTNIYIH